MRHDIEWVTAPPLWDLAQADGGTRPRFRQPALLRFESDSFMEELIGLLETGSADLADRVAKPETWEAPDAGWVMPGDSSLAKTLNLFQPVHGRFYIGAASLVCRRVGLPMRAVNKAESERTSMLMRRLVPRTGGAIVNPADADTFIEQAWVGDRKQGVWTAVAAGGPTVVSGEERLPLFPLSTSIEEGRTRQVWAGMLPVASREIYEGAAAAGAAARPLEPGTSPDPLAQMSDPRRATFAARVIQGFAALAEASLLPVAAELESFAPDMRESLAFTLLDFADFLLAELNPLWNAIVNENPANLSPASDAVYDALGASLTGTGTWREALRRVDRHRPALLGTGTATGPAPISAGLSAANLRTSVSALVAGDSLQSLVFAALGTPPPAPPPVIGGPPVAFARAAETVETAGALYYLRFVYERPLCAPFHDPVVSAPSRAFRLGGFFDPDAPARPLVIRMPLDTSPKGLRKFPKGVGVLMSSKLRQQVEQVRNAKLKDIDEGNINSEPSWGIGMICSLSIPIITLCAFIVLMIFLSLLNIVFWWMAFFKICLPIPVRNE
jgi:hypothetical protein